MASIINTEIVLYVIQKPFKECKHNNVQMTDPVKKIKNATQDAEAKIQTSKDHAEGKPSSEKLNKAKVKVRDALT
jgi:hypothetical protein